MNTSIGTAILDQPLTAKYLASYPAEQWPDAIVATFLYGAYSLRAAYGAFLNLDALQETARQAYALMNVESRLAPLQNSLERFRRRLASTEASLHARLDSPSSQLATRRQPWGESPRSPLRSSVADFSQQTPGSKKPRRLSSTQKVTHDVRVPLEDTLCNSSTKRHWTHAMHWDPHISNAWFMR